MIALLMSGTVRVAGGSCKLVRETVEGIDTFVGRYLLLTTVGYVVIKFVHFKLLPDFPPA